MRGLTHRVAVEPPQIEDGEALFAHFEPKRWLGLLPLLHFLRSLTKDIGWEDSPLRACFLFDDANLHAFTYGHLDFRQIAREAREHKYHVVFATVPADGWYVRAEVARFFAEQSNYVSLTVHGVQHTRWELSRANGHALPLLALGLRRLEELERKTGLTISRVMVPPHEAWANSISDSMLKLRYEGACVNTECLAAKNLTSTWLQHWGLGPVSWVGDGFPILPRFPFAGDGAVTGVRLAAYLGQPVILKGHHWDCSYGIDVLRQRAAVLNELGACWGTLQTISRSSYKTRTAGATLQIQMCSRQIQLQVPEYARSICIERPWLGETEQEPLLCKVDDGASKTFLCGRNTEPIEVVPGATVHVSALPKEQVDYRNVAAAGTSLWAIVRRVLVEGRDRLQPLLGVKV